MSARNDSSPAAGLDRTLLATGPQWFKLDGVADTEGDNVWVEAENSLRHAVSKDRPGTFLCGKQMQAYARSAVELDLPEDDVRCARCDRVAKQTTTGLRDSI